VRLNGEPVTERRIRLHHILSNIPLLIGGLIVLALFIGILFGPVLAPHNPYLHGRRATEYVDGVVISPPYPPSPDYPLGSDELGRDTLSMLLYGTRNTVVAAIFITMARLILGLVLGGLAGWHEGKLMDQIVTGTIQMLAALPMLLVAVIIIYAMDIRRGLPVFITALCAIGWGEIAQYIRAEFICIKQEPFLDSGRAIGLTPLELAIRHVLPNILPVLIVITLLEMGAVLMILGGLGFVGVFVGGGISVQIDDFLRRQYFTVPEWGAMMAGSRAWARSRPWMVMSPAIAFFISVTGFNLLGEGLRRLIDRGLFSTAVLLSWRFLVAAALITAASIYVILTLGPAPSYRQLAEQVSEDALMSHVKLLSAPEMNGRGVGSPEAYRAAEYITDELRSYGLTPPPGGWLQEVSITLAQPAEPPVLALLDPENDDQPRLTFTRWVDYSESTERHGGSGQTDAPVTLIVFPATMGAGDRQPEQFYRQFKGLDLRGRIVMFLAGNGPADLDTEALIRGASGILIVSSDVRPRNQVVSSDYLEHPSLPVFYITPATADTILAGDGLTVEAVKEQITQLSKPGPDGAQPPWVAHDLDARVRMRLQLEPPRTVTAYNILWLLNGADATMAEELVVISAHYDGLGVAPDGTRYPGANGNASGVAAMLEIVRLWQDQEFEPRRSVLFAAWAGGEWPYSGAHDFRDNRRGFTSRYNIAAVVHLDRLATLSDSATSGSAASGDGLVVHQAGRDDSLFNLLASSAERLDLTVRQGNALCRHYQYVFSGEQGDQLGGRNGTLVVTRGDPQPALAADTIDAISIENLSKATQAVNLALITAAHEPRY
jgi:ABC-type dipeptide/oligopeptide/nickel transport system permease subunit